MRRRQWWHPPNPSPPRNNRARDAPSSPATRKTTPSGVAIDGGILTSFSSWTTVSSSPWTAAPDHGPRDPPPGNHHRHKEAPPLARSLCTEVEDNKRWRMPHRYMNGAMTTHTSSRGTRSRSITAATSLSRNEGELHRCHHPHARALPG
jgi:hypothetical protein